MKVKEIFTYARLVPGNDQLYVLVQTNVNLHTLCTVLLSMIQTGPCATFPDESPHSNIIDTDVRWSKDHLLCVQIPNI